jgi:hypothetical protein
MTSVFFFFNALLRPEDTCGTKFVSTKCVVILMNRMVCYLLYFVWQKINFERRQAKKDQQSSCCKKL